MLNIAQQLHNDRINENPKLLIEIVQPGSFLKTQRIGVVNHPISHRVNRTQNTGRFNSPY
jgi:hypothetical protein